MLADNLGQKAESVPFLPCMSSCFPAKQSQLLCPFPTPCPKSTTKTLSAFLLVQGHCPLVFKLGFGLCRPAEGEDFINSTMQSCVLNYYMSLKKGWFLMCGSSKIFLMPPIALAFKQERQELTPVISTATKQDPANTFHHFHHIFVPWLPQSWLWELPGVWSRNLQGCF